MEDFWIGNNPGVEAKRARQIVARLMRDKTKEQTMTRCKFQCQSVRKFKSQGKFLYEAEFYAVTGDSEENKKFFEWTPSGNLKVGVYKEDIFQPGKNYYLDIHEAD